MQQEWGDLEWGGGAGGGYEAPPPVAPPEPIPTGLVTEPPGAQPAAPEPFNPTLVQAPPGTAGEPTGEGGAWDFAKGLYGSVFGPQSPLSSFAQTLGLGVTGLGIANQLAAARQAREQQGIARQAAASAQAAAQPAISYGAEQLARARAGKLAPAMEAEIAEWARKAKVDMAARYAKMGIPASTSAAQIDQLVEQQALAMRSEMLRQMAQGGINATQVGAQAAGTGANIAGTQQNLLLGLIASANQQLARMGAQTA